MSQCSLLHFEHCGKQRSRFQVHYACTAQAFRWAALSFEQYLRLWMSQARSRWFQVGALTTR